MMNTVLIVDDITTNRKIIRGILSKTIEGINIIEAEDGYKALDLIEEGLASVVILDIMMPGMDGIEVLASIKSNEATKNIPVIMCSAITEIESIEKALKLGALDYFTKPLSESQMKINLPLKVKNALEYYENRNELVKFYEHIKDEMQLAEKLQKSLVYEYKDFKVAEMWGRYIPCEEVGGDIFCFKKVKDKVWFLMADISGHGISAAMISTMLNVIFSTCVEFCSGPDEIVERINKMLFEVFNGSKYGLISAFAGYIENDTLCYVNAGHPYPVLYRHDDKTVEFLEAKGFLLGIFQSCEYTSEIKKIGSQDSILLYTDGIFDKGMNKGYANWDAVRKYCSNNISGMELDNGMFLDNMLKHFSTVGGGKFIDDVAVMLIKSKIKE